MAAPVVHRFSKFLRHALAAHLQRPEVGLRLADNEAGADRIMPFWPMGMELKYPAAAMVIQGRGEYTQIHPRVIKSDLNDHRVHYGNLSAQLKLDLWVGPEAGDEGLDELVGRVHWAFSELDPTGATKPGRIRIPVPLYLDCKADYILRDVQDVDNIRTANRREYRATIMIDGRIPRVRQYTDLFLAKSIETHIWAETSPDVFNQPFPGTLVEITTPLGSGFSSGFSDGFG